MTIALRPITQANWQAVYNLTEKLNAEQQHFVAPNSYSMLEALYEPDMYTSRAIYAVDAAGTETLVGYIQNSYDRAYDQHWIDRIMIIAEHQGKGYGRAALHQVIAEVQATPGSEALYICFEPNNDVARALYASLGFLDTGELEDGEVVYRLPFPPTNASEPHA